MIDKSPKTVMYRATKNLVAREMLQHNVETPIELVDDMLSSVACSLTKDAQILVLFNLEFVISLKEDFPFTRENITLFTDGDAQLERIAQKMNINTIESLSTDMKFDLTLGNPPYSEDQGNKLLYPDFFELCLEKSDHVMMLMPIKLDGKGTKIKAHNYRVMRHQTFISEDVSGSFNVSVGRISYVIASKAVQNEVQEVAAVELPVLLPSRDRLSVVNGKAFETASKGFAVVHKVHKSGIVEDKCTKAHKDMFRSFYKKQTKRISPWVVMINHTPSKGVFNAEIVKDTGDLVWSRWVFVVQAQTKSEANRIVSYLQSDMVVEYLRDNMTSHAVSKTILQALPNHE